MKKECKNCNNKKEVSEFYKAIRNSDGHSSWCKGCSKDKVEEYSKTKKGLIGKIYQTQKKNSKNRGDKLPDYSLSEFRQWVSNNKYFDQLYQNWVDSNYEKDLRPSVDRKNDYLPYTLVNIQLTYWKNNKDKGSSDRKNGVNNKVNKTVYKYSLEGNFIEEYHSLAEAERQTGNLYQSISQCCNGITQSCGGYKWTFKKVLIKKQTD